MSDTAIRVENLSKRYRIGLKEQVHDTFGAALAEWVRRPGQNLRRLRSLRRFEHDEGAAGDGADILWALKDVSFEVKHGKVVSMRKREVDRKFDEPCLRTGPWTSRAWSASSTHRLRSIPAACGCAQPLPWPHLSAPLRMSSSDPMVYSTGVWFRNADAEATSTGELECPK